MSSARTTRNGMPGSENPAELDSAGSAADSKLRPAGVAAPDHRLRWPESVAITLALLLGGAVAAGLFRPMLPWLG